VPDDLDLAYFRHVAQIFALGFSKQLGLSTSGTSRAAISTPLSRATIFQR